MIRPFCLASGRPDFTVSLACRLSARICSRLRHMRATSLIMQPARDSFIKNDPAIHLRQRKAASERFKRNRVIQAGKLPQMPAAFRARVHLSKYTLLIENEIALYAGHGAYNT